MFFATARCVEFAFYNGYFILVFNAVKISDSVAVYIFFQIEDT